MGEWNIGVNSYCLAVNDDVMVGCGYEGRLYVFGNSLDYNLISSGMGSEPVFLEFIDSDVLMAFSSTGELFSFEFIRNHRSEFRTLLFRTLC